MGFGILEGLGSFRPWGDVGLRASGLGFRV